MKASEELKNKILSQIDSLDDDILEEFYGHMKNFINSKSEIEIWDSLSEAQQTGIKKAIEQIDAGKGLDHSSVISNIRQKYSDA